MKNYKFFIKSIISIGLIWYLLSEVEFTAVYASLKSAQPIWLLFAFITLNIGKLLTGYRWQILLEAQGIKIPLRSLIASVFVGQFFNSFLPTTIGGDAVRAYDTATQSNESTKSVISVFIDRLIGFFALTLLAALALLMGYIIGEDVSFYVLPVCLIFCICSFGAIIFYNNSLIEIMVRFLKLFKLSKIAEKLIESSQSFSMLRSKPRVLISALIISLALQINVILFYYFIGVALDLNVSFLYFAIIVPIALVVLLVPFSINGIGIREGIFVFLLTELGVLPKDAIALSWISFGLALTQGIIGGVIFALRGGNFRSSQIDNSVSD
jgi:uncharacterized protein (TIRG00374 family)